MIEAAILFGNLYPADIFLHTTPERALRESRSLNIIWTKSLNANGISQSITFS